MDPRKAMTPAEKQAEEEKRERAYDPHQRWLAIERAIALATENMPPEQRRNRPRWHPGTKFRASPDQPFTSAEPGLPPDHRLAD